MRAFTVLRGFSDRSVHLRAFGKPAVLAVVCAAVLAGSASARPTSSRITLGQSIGSMRLGMSRAQVRQILGRGMQVGSEYNHRLNLDYPKLGMSVQFAGSKTIGIATTNPAYTTAKGVGVGRSTQADVQAAYPGAHCIASNGSYSCESMDGLVRPGIARFTGFACSEEGEHDVVSIAVGFGHP